MPTDGRERFIAASDTEIADWIAAAAWEGYPTSAAAVAALGAAETGEGVEDRLAERPGVYA